MSELKFNSTGSDSLYLSNVNIFFGVVFDLEVFRTRWAEDKLGSQSTLQQGIDWFRQMYEGGLSGNRYHIAERKAARQDLDLKIQKILHYLSVMAEQSDLARLLKTGVVRYKARKSPKKSARPAVVSQP